MTNTSCANTLEGVSHLLNASSIVFMTFMICVNVMAILGNVSICITVLKTPNLRCNITYLFVLNLCCADLLGAALTVPLSISIHGGGSWAASRKLCLLHGFLNSLTSFASVMAVCLISVERFYAIKLPMHYSAHMTVIRAVSIVGGAWLECILLAMLPCVGWNSYAYRQHQAVCTYSRHSSDWFAPFVAVVCFLVPCAVMLCMYFGIYRVAKSAVRQVALEPNASANRFNKTNDEALSVYTITAVSSRLRCSNAAKPMPQRRAHSPWKAIRTLLLVTGSFFVLWGPQFFLDATIGLHMKLVHDGTLEKVARWLGYMSFAVNPFIYGWLNRQIRESFVSTVRQWRHCAITPAEVVAGDSRQNNENFMQFLERTSTITHALT